MSKSIMTYEEFNDYLLDTLVNNPHYDGPCVVEFKAKYYFEDEYSHYIECIDLEYDNNADPHILWYSDWNEDQNDIILQGIYCISELLQTYKNVKSAIHHAEMCDMEE